MHPRAREVSERLAAIRTSSDPPEYSLTQTRVELCYLVFFTPRSGSSWLTELLSTHSGFGQPSEWFNPDFIPATAEHLHVDNLFDYICALKQNFSDSTTNTFGAEITFFQLEVMRQLVDFFAHFPLTMTKTIYLSRKDIKSQAISLYRAVKSGIFHSNDLKDGHAPEVEYDADQICYWLEHLVQQEIGFDRLFGEFSIRPERIYYEDMMSARAQDTVSRISWSLFGRDFTGEVSPPSANRKLTYCHEEWLTNFSSDRATYCEELLRYRSEDR